MYRTLAGAHRARDQFDPDRVGAGFQRQPAVFLIQRKRFPAPVHTVDSIGNAASRNGINTEAGSADR